MRILSFQTRIIKHKVRVYHLPCNMQTEYMHIHRRIF